MVHRLSRLLRLFKDDESGAFAVLFGLMAVALIALGGAVVDYSLLHQRRATAQIALDSAVLGLQPRIKDMSSQELGETAVRLVRERLDGEEITVTLERSEVDLEKGSLRVVAKFEAPTYFVTLVGVHRLGAVVAAEALRKSLRVEIVMVLDNSGSMAESNRMGHLKAAAHRATNIFFRDQHPNDDDPSMFVGVVPFTQFVNVGPDKANEPWIDRWGVSSIANDNFMLDANAPLTQVDRIALFGRLTNESWRGCVEARAFPNDTNDNMPLSSSPETLFSPLFAPDEPDTTNGWGQYLYNNTYIADQRGKCEKPPRNRAWSERTLQERMCKYDGATVSRQSTEYARGPNADCPANALTALTPTKPDIERGLARMLPQGGTNIAQGVVWGLHMLTPSPPLEEAAPFDQSVSKVMIVMTDGDNFHAASNNMNGSVFYTAYGYPYNRRLGKPGDSTTLLRSMMNDRLLATCRTAKMMGIKIYTIGLSVPSQSTEEVLKTCSSGDGYWFLPENPSDLNGIFEEIANRLALLRLAL